MNAGAKDGANPAGAAEAAGAGDESPTTPKTWSEWYEAKLDLLNRLKFNFFGIKHTNVEGIIEVATANQALNELWNDFNKERQDLSKKAIHFMHINLFNKIDASGLGVFKVFIYYAHPNINKTAFAEKYSIPQLSAVLYLLDILKKKMHLGKASLLSIFNTELSNIVAENGGASAADVLVAFGHTIMLHENATSEQVAAFLSIMNNVQLVDSNGNKVTIGDTFKTLSVSLKQSINQKKLAEKNRQAAST